MCVQSRILKHVHSWNPERRHNNIRKHKNPKEWNFLVSDSLCSLCRLMSNSKCKINYLFMASEYPRGYKQGCDDIIEETKPFYSAFWMITCTQNSYFMPIKDSVNLILSLGLFFKRLNMLKISNLLPRFSDMIDDLSDEKYINGYLGSWCPIKATNMIYLQYLHITSHGLHIIRQWRLSCKESYEGLSLLLHLS